MVPRNPPYYGEQPGAEGYARPGSRDMPHAPSNPELTLLHYPTSSAQQGPVVPSRSAKYDLRLPVVSNVVG